MLTLQIFEMDNLAPGPSSVDSIRYEEKLQALDRMVELNRALVGSTGSIDS